MGDCSAFGFEGTEADKNPDVLVIIAGNEYDGGATYGAISTNENFGCTFGESNETIN